MIDATKSPLPAWKRYAMLVALAALIVVAAYVLWTKELHHSSSPGPSASPPAAQPVVPSGPRTGSPVVKTAPTTVPGGIPVSSRNPFGG